MSESTPRTITDEDVAKAIRAYKSVSPGQALWAVFGDAYQDQHLFHHRLLEGGMRAALEAVARARADRATAAQAGDHSAAVTALARDAARFHGRATGRATDITAAELGAWEDVVTLVLSRAKVSL